MIPSLQHMSVSAVHNPQRGSSESPLFCARSLPPQSHFPYTLHFQPFHYPHSPKPRQAGHLFSKDFHPNTHGCPTAPSGCIFSFGWGCFSHLGLPIFVRDSCLQFKFKSSRRIPGIIDFLFDFFLKKISSGNLGALQDASSTIMYFALQEGLTRFLGPVLSAHVKQIFAL